MNSIIVKGARIHNLKNINITIPKNKLIVATGVSGSGKSSLVFDIIFEEGRRQYLQSLGLLPGIDDEDKFDSIAGISPTIAVQQNIIRQSNHRSTVGSKTNILKLLGLLYAREGQITCYSCGTPIGDSLVCEQCGNTEERLPASYFSYNDPNGMCIKCAGRGAYFEINIEKLVPDHETTLEQVLEAVQLTPGFKKLLHRKFSDHLATPFFNLPDQIMQDILYGHQVTGNQEKRSFCLYRLFKGRLYRNDDDSGGVFTTVVCSECHGFRIGEEARNVLLNGKHIGHLGQMTIAELYQFLTSLSKEAVLSAFGKNLLQEVLAKTSSLLKFRLGHLSLFREMPTLSGGEIQRIFLTCHLDSKLDSLIYILDEPTSGLHESEKIDLLRSIKGLKELGNTVIVIEHDRNMIEMAEHIIDIGPKAGIEGGQVVYQGNLEGLLQCRQSITGQYLSGAVALPQRTKQNLAADKLTKYLTVRHAQTNNLKDITVSFPLGALVGIAGVSGSGKSSLISNTLIPMLKRYLKVKKGSRPETAEKEIFDNIPVKIKAIAERLEGAQHISGYAEVAQVPIGRNNNSNPATYLGIWDKIRQLFARQPEAIEQDLAAGHFSFNSKGACSKCGGSGRDTIWLGGSLSTSVICPDCQGKRYNDQALAVKYNDKSILDVLAMSVSAAVIFFKNTPGIVTPLRVLERIGMGYIKLGQPTPTLSGGEAQRLKLAKEIGKRRKGRILYVLDEPTTGLSMYDTAKLLQLLDELVVQGNSVIVIEHDPLVLSSCDWIIELGPQGGTAGGEIIAEGIPQLLKANHKSVTGRYL